MWTRRLLRPLAGTERNKNKKCKKGWIVCSGNT
jgi:hypothetical protein